MSGALWVSAVNSNSKFRLVVMNNRLLWVSLIMLCRFISTPTDTCRNIILTAEVNIVFRFISWYRYFTLKAYFDIRLYSSVAGRFEGALI